MTILLIFIAIMFWSNKANGQINNYLNVSQNSNVVTTGSVSELDGTSEFTLEAHVNLNVSTSWTHVLSKILSNKERISLQVHNGKVYCIVANGENSYRYTSSAILQTGVWYHLAIVHKGSLNGYNKIKLVKDGVLVPLSNSSKPLPSLTDSNTSAFKVGASAFDGKIDDVRIWDKALSVYRINNWKNKHIDATHPEYNNLKLYWDFDDANTPNVANNSAGVTYNVTPPPPSTTDKKDITYLPYYKFQSVSAEIFNHLTQINYFSLGMDSLGELGRFSNTGVFTSLSNIPQVVTDLNTLKSWRGTRTTKIQVTFGEWVQSNEFDEMAANASSRANFVQNVKNFLIANGVDGADLDWEGYNGSVNDTHYGLLINELKTAFNDIGLGLSVAYRF